MKPQKKKNPENHCEEISDLDFCVTNYSRACSNTYSVLGLSALSALDMKYYF